MSQQAAGGDAAGRIRGLVADLAPRDRAVAPEMRLEEDLGYDSLLLVELAVAIEREFALPPIAEEQAMDIRTVADIERLVAGVLAEPA